MLNSSKNKTAYPTSDELLRRYRIYYHPAEGYRAVKVGFSWPGFFFGSLWAIYLGLWAVGLLVLSTRFFILFLQEMVKFGGLQPDIYAFTNFILIIISIVHFVIPGMYGNSWVEKRLMAIDFKFEREVSGVNLETAILRSYKNRL